MNQVIDESSFAKIQGQLDKSCEAVSHERQWILVMIIRLAALKIPNLKWVAHVDLLRRKLPLGMESSHRKDTPAASGGLSCPRNLWVQPGELLGVFREAL